MYCKRRDEKNDYDYMCVMERKKQECTPENRMMIEEKKESRKMRDQRKIRGIRNPGGEETKNDMDMYICRQQRR